MPSNASAITTANTAPNTVAWNCVRLGSGSRPGLHAPHTDRPHGTAFPHRMHVSYGMG